MRGCKQRDEARKHQEKKVLEVTDTKYKTKEKV